MRSRSSNGFAVLTAICASGWAQTPPAATDQPAAISGVVTNSVTGEPIPRAHVLFRPVSNRPNANQQTYGAMTTADGKFSIAPIQPANYTVFTEHAGFDSPPIMRPLKIDPGDKKDDYKIEMIPQGAITGRVVDANGDAVEGAVVTADGSGTGAGPGSTTDEKGQFRIGALRPAKYRIRASQPSLPIPAEIRTDGTSEIHYAATYYPSSLTEKGSTKVAVAAGSEVNDLEIRLIRTPMVRVSGTVVGFAKSAEPQSINISATPETGGGNTHGAAKPDGTFELWRLDPGKYVLVAQQYSPGQTLQTAPVDIEVAGSHIDHVELRVVPLFDVSGIVQYEDEQAKPQPPQSQTQQAQGGRSGQQPPPPARLSLRELNGLSAQRMGAQPPVTIGADGSFTIHQLAAGRYLVELAWNNAYVKSLQVGTVQMPGRILDLRNGTGGVPVTVVVSSAVGEVSGSVRNGDDPAPGKRIVLAPDPSDGSGVYMGGSRPDGSYRLSGIAPGKYKLAIIGDLDQAAMSGRGLDDYDDALEVNVSAGDKLTKDLKVRK
jgi:hypothetical protein